MSRGERLLMSESFKAKAKSGFYEEISKELMEACEGDLWNQDSDTETEEGSAENKDQNHECEKGNAYEVKRLLSTGMVDGRSSCGPIGMANALFHTSPNHKTKLSLRLSSDRTFLMFARTCAQAFGTTRIRKISPPTADEPTSSPSPAAEQLDFPIPAASDAAGGPAANGPTSRTSPIRE